ncbi:hypothetical protein ABVT39_000219 [Epinephelus coioides]
MKSPHKNGFWRRIFLIKIDFQNSWTNVSSIKKNWKKKSQPTRKRNLRETWRTTREALFTDGARLPPTKRLLHPGQYGDVELPTDGDGAVTPYQHRAPPPWTPTRTVSILMGPVVFYERTTDATNEEEEVKARQEVSPRAACIVPAARKRTDHPQSL